MNILLCGFMGAGKTFLLDRLKNSSDGFEFYDLDIEVSKWIGIGEKAIGEWINLNGLTSFREKEMEVLKNLLENSRPKVVALGGGTVSHSDFFQHSSKFHLVFLNTSFETCFERIYNDSNRPLTSQGEEKLRELYQARLPFYQKAELTLDEKGIKEIVGVNSLVHNLGKSKLS